MIESPFYKEILNSFPQKSTSLHKVHHTHNKKAVYYPSYDSLSPRLKSISDCDVTKSCNIIQVSGRQNFWITGSKGICNLLEDSIAAKNGNKSSRVSVNPS
jgi:hypothetical protein